MELSKIGLSISNILCHSRGLPLRLALSQHGRKHACDRTIKFMAISDLLTDYLNRYLDVSKVIEMPQKKERKKKQEFFLWL